MHHRALLVADARVLEVVDEIDRALKEALVRRVGVGRAPIHGVRERTWGDRLVRVRGVERDGVAIAHEERHDLVQVLGGVGTQQDVAALLLRLLTVATLASSSSQNRFEAPRLASGCAAACVRP